MAQKRSIPSRTVTLARASRHGRQPGKNNAESSLRPEYHRSWAVVIGINNYQELTSLNFAVNDAASVAELLIKDLGFPKEQVWVILDPPPEGLAAAASQDGIRGFLNPPKTQDHATR